MADAINAPEKEPEDPNQAPQGNNIGNSPKDMINNMKSEDFMPGKNKGMPTALKVIQWLLIIGAVFSLLSGLSFFSFAPFAGVLALISAAASLVIIWGINKRAMWAYWLLIALIIYSVITVFVSWRGGNVITLVIDGIILYYITKSKKWFMPTDKAM